MKIAMPLVMFLGVSLSAPMRAQNPATAPNVTGQVVKVGKGVFKDAVVILEGTKKSDPLTKAVIDQRSKVFLPHVSVVTKGTTVEFPNNDTVFHNVFAYYDAKKFDLGNYPRGSSKSVKFDKVGVVALLCNIHAEMSAYIYVVDTPYYAVTDKQGRFQIKEVAPGEYTLKVWHESGYSLTQRISVKSPETSRTLILARK